MASSNRHWPSLFKSKPCNTHHQWQHDINSSSLLSGGYQKTSYTSGCEERSPEPKPRWNPKPEQIRILEAIFNSGMVNPPRDEIRKIRAQLQEYGQVGDANVFYWFQNRKSRSKHKHRHLQSSRSHSRSAAATAATITSTPTVTSPVNSTNPASSTSSTSDRSTGSDKPLTSIGDALTGCVMDTSTLPTAPVSPMYFLGGIGGGDQPFYNHNPNGYSFSAAPDLSGIPALPEQSSGVCLGLWSELMGQEGCKSGEDDTKFKMQLHHGYGVAVHPTATATNATAAVGDGGATTIGPATSAATVAGPVNEIQGLGMASGGAARLAVFINEVAFEVGAGPLNLRAAFGEEAVLLHSSGHPVLTDEFGVTLHSLQHGASYYLMQV
ncbi:WUSCHEL-related homeobox 9-like isoform X1 [Typha latifolia]|uniref:WUSCHEL-related homeobox 9-like isoform X1 n=1 Tax=Typha latifolia TaxID=4733 RepID=UPI003C2F0C36